MRIRIAVLAVVVLVLVAGGWAFRFEQAETVIARDGYSRKMLVRTNRFTGKAQYLSGYGWLPLDDLPSLAPTPAAVASPDPYAAAFAGLESPKPR